jgi:hypothetical protein
VPVKVRFFGAVRLRMTSFNIIWTDYQASETLTLGGARGMTASLGRHPSYSYRIKAYTVGGLLTAKNAKDAKETSDFFALFAPFAVQLRIS